MEDTFNLLNENIPNLLTFAIKCQDEILLKGRSLSENEINISKLLKIQYSDKIRILEVQNFQRPINSILNDICDKLGFINNEGNLEPEE